MNSTKIKNAFLAGMVILAAVIALVWIRQGRRDVEGEKWRAEWQKPAMTSVTNPVPPPAVDGDGLPVLDSIPDDAAIRTSRAFASALLPVDDGSLSADQKARQNTVMATYLREYRKLGRDAAWESLSPSFLTHVLSGFRLWSLRL